MAGVEVPLAVGRSAVPAADRHNRPAGADCRSGGGRDRGPLMPIVPAVRLFGAVVVGLIPGVVPAIERAATNFADHG